ncbi:MAG: hypothetical protein OIF50_04260 [Flavobacteriaceae bacterium]|nr:hypothetical protein [Flavobacteriaceae bacterium]
MSKVLKGFGLIGVLLILIFIIFHFGIIGVFTKQKRIVKQKELNYYHGLVYDINKKPIDSVYVFLGNTNYTWFTNRKGYFRTDVLDLKSLNSISFYKDGYKRKNVNLTHYDNKPYLYMRIEMFSRKELDTIILYKE